MEENQNAGQLLDRLEDWLSQKRMAPALKKAQEQLKKEQLQTPGSAGFVTGYTACARRQIKALVLLLCGCLIALFSLLANSFVWGYFAAVFCAVLAVVVWIIAVAKRRASPIVWYTNQEIRIFSQKHKNPTVIPYSQLTEIYIHGEQAALCTTQNTWVLTAGEHENLKEMQAFLEKLAALCPGKTFTDES